MEKVKLNIDGINIEVAKGTTVLEAARLSGIYIPTLCFLKEVSSASSCRVCLVEFGSKLIASCTLAVEEGMEIKTNSSKVREARKTMVELLLSNHRRECTSCSRSENCELQSLCKDLNIRDVRFEGVSTKMEIDDSSTSVVRDNEKCVLCGRCIGACGGTQTVHAIGFANRGFETQVTPPNNKPLAETVCVNCGQCILACPVGALQEKENISDVWKALDNPQKVVVVQTAPAVRVALGEEFGMPVGTRVTGKMVAALRKMGFDYVFDTDFAADLTIMEEGTELLGRLESGKGLPLMTSCCPGWVKFVEHNYPELIENLSTCKSPHEMEGALIKSYFAQKMGIDSKSIVVVSIMPCVAKKFENQREELSSENMRDVDYVLTTRELAQMIKESGINFATIMDDAFDNPFGVSTGAGVIFGATGGVAEAALRTIFEITAGEDLEKVDYADVRGLEGIKEISIKLPNGRVITTAVVHGLGNAREIIKLIKSGEKDYKFIEVMACPGGCITGGGQPIINSRLWDMIDIKEERARAIYDEDESVSIRKSHKNPYIESLYKEYLGVPNSHLSHKLLHTHYKERSKY